MRALEEKILRDGKVFPGHVLNVGSFLNQQLDVSLLTEMGREIARLYAGTEVTKIVTIEASGIALAVTAAQAIGVPVVVVKKSAAANQSPDVYTAEVYSYTHGRTFTATVSRAYIGAGDKVLVVDDFLAVGNAVRGLCEIVRAAGAEVVGCAIAVEKQFQGGGDGLRAEGLRVESLAKIASMSDDGLTFCR